MDENSKVDLKTETINCVLADFSSAVDDFTLKNLYCDGPSQNEQTDEYAPPEALFGLFGDSWIPFDSKNPMSYDSWSIGVIILELLLGSPDVFSIISNTNRTVSGSKKLKRTYFVFKDEKC